MNDENNSLHEESLDATENELALEPEELDASPLSYDDFDRLTTLRADALATSAPTSQPQTVDEALEPAPVAQPVELTVESETPATTEARSSETERAATDVALQDVLTEPVKIAAQERENPRTQAAGRQERARGAAQARGETARRENATTAPQSLRGQNRNTERTSPTAQTLQTSQSASSSSLPNSPPSPRVDSNQAQSQDEPKPKGCSFGVVLVIIFLLFASSFFGNTRWIATLLIGIFVYVVVSSALSKDKSNDRPS